MSEPLLAFASTTMIICESPLMMRFLAGKCTLDGGVPGGYSDNKRPLCLSTVSNNRLFSGGYTISKPHPITTIT